MRKKTNTCNCYSGRYCHTHLKYGVSTKISTKYRNAISTERQQNQVCGGGIRVIRKKPERN